MADYLAISEKQKVYLQSNCNRMTTKEIANNLDVSETKISGWMKELHIVKKRVTGPRKVVPYAPKEGFFDGSQMDNWIAY